MTIQCKECLKQIAKTSFRYHLKTAHNCTMIDYRIKHEHFIPFTCEICGEKLSSKIRLAVHKLKIHGIDSESKKRTTRIALKKDESNIKCEICGKKFTRLRNLSYHLKKEHSIDVTNYYKEYMMKENDFENCKQCGKPNNFRFDRGFNDFCSFSCSTTWYANNTDRVSVAMKTLNERKENDPTYCLNPTQKQYWINKGFNEEDAGRKLRERQQTFSKEKLIEKLGEEAGLIRWNDRQEKWISTLNNKPKEERERIARAKMGNGRGYSKISQVLFNRICEKLLFNGRIYYATRKNDDIIVNDISDHFEYMVIDDNKDNVYFLDFYIPLIKYCIEFDGDYWHGEKTGNKEREVIRENEIKERIPDITIVRIKERDYKENPERIINELITDILNRLELKNATTEKI